jgi:hypothetical protein
MPAEDAAAARLAFAQVLGRVYDRLFEQGCEPVIKAIAQRPNSSDKLQRFQALEILNRRVEKFAEEHDVPEVAASAHVWTTLARLCAKTVWRNLSATEGASVPAPNETSVLVGFVDDAELMGILGLQAGWPPDVKRIDPDLDLTATDLDGGLS